MDYTVICHHLLPGADTGTCNFCDRLVSHGYIWLDTVSGRLANPQLSCLLCGRVCCLRAVCRMNPFLGANAVVPILLCPRQFIIDDMSRLGR